MASEGLTGCWIKGRGSCSLERICKHPKRGQRKKRGVDYLPDIECHSGVNWAELSVSRLGQL